MRHHPTPGLRQVGRRPIERAAQLVSEDRVRQLSAAEVYLVRGDHDNYRVVASPDGIFCPCEARTPLCAHVLAVAQVRTQERADAYGFRAAAI